MSKVWFAPLDPHHGPDALRARLGALADAAGLASLVQPEDLVALKTHFGEEGNDNYIRPALLMPLVERVLQADGKPFWTDTNTLYVGERANAVEHLLLAHRHGFSIEATGIPTVIADGLTGREELRVRVDGRHSAEVGIAAGVAAASALLVITHGTGHLVSGYGGALKNLGMGLSSRKGKLYQHCVVKPWVKAQKCSACGSCLDWCPEDAILLEEHASIDEQRCIGCGECLAACRVGAVRFAWKMASAGLQERMAEQAAGVVRHFDGRIGYVTFLTQVAKDCDCLPSHPDDVLLPALGLLASRDPVALDQASIDLIERQLGRPLRAAAYDVDWSPQLTEAEALGLGSRSYELRTLEG